MAYNFIPYDYRQQYLLPPSLQDWLPEGHLAWFVMDAVGAMDLSAFYGRYRTDGVGHPAHDPGMMVRLLLYTYCEGERSSRVIERLCERDIAYRIITANQVPDHSTIARFRRSHEEALGRLFIEVLRLCVAAGLVKVGVVALDGTKVKGNAALSANRTSAHLEEEVKKMLAEAQAVDAQEDALYGADKRGDELPEELRNPRSRKARILECKKRLEEEAQAVQCKQAEKIEARRAEEDVSGKKKRGRKPKSPEDMANKEAKANVSDPESRIMKTRTGYIQGFNAQAVVTEEQIILAADVTQEENDVRQLHPMLEATQANLDEAGIEEKIGTCLADAGYWSQTNVENAPGDGPELLIATQKDWKQRQEAQNAPAPRGRIPKTLSARKQMEWKLRTSRGKRLYKKRGQTVEPVFGQIKDSRGCDRLSRRGLLAAKAEWLLLCLTHNLLKLWRRERACRNRVLADFQGCLAAGMHSFFAPGYHLGNLIPGICAA